MLFNLHKHLIRFVKRDICVTFAVINATSLNKIKFTAINKLLYICVLSANYILRTIILVKLSRFVEPRCAITKIIKTVIFGLFLLLQVLTSHM